MEIWKESSVRGDTYQVSNLGRVRNYKTGVILKTPVDSKGYPRICLIINGKPKTFKVHRLVADVFLQNKNNKRTVNHIDGNKSNNNVKNLEWATYSENLYHAHDLGLKKPAIGERHGSSKLTSEQVSRIINNYDRKKHTYKMLADKYNVAESTIGVIIRRSGWKHIDARVDNSDSQLNR